MSAAREYEHLAAVRAQLAARDLDEAARLLGPADDGGDVAGERVTLADDGELGRSLALADLDGCRAILGELRRLPAVRTDWNARPPAREWLAPGWLPAGRVGLLTGPGSAGKSRLALQLAVAVAGDGGAEASRVLPSDRRGEDAADDAGPVVSGKLGRVAIVGWEDEADEVSRRVGWLAGAGVRAAAGLGDRLAYLDAAAAGFGALWNPEAHAWDAAGREVLEWAEGHSPRLVILDPLAAVFAGNENDRAAVRAFMVALGAWAAHTGAAVLAVAHPAKASEGEGATYSGSTDWRNAARTLWTLRRERVRSRVRVGDHESVGEAGTAPAPTLEKAF